VKAREHNAKTPFRRTGLLAILRALLGARGTGAPSQRHALVAVVLVTSFAALIFVASASARQTRLYTGTSFGPNGTGAGSFEEIRSIAVDQSDDVYVYDALAEKVYKFDAGGAPVEFSALGSNAIEEIGGAFEGGAVEQIAVAPTGSPSGTAGDIYVANNTIVKVYSQAGTELGTLGEGETCGVAVNPAGHLFIGSFSETIREYVPTANPPTDADLTAFGTASIGLCNVAADGGGKVYATNFRGSETAGLEGIADPAPTLIEPGGATLTTDPLSNDLYLDQGDHVSVYDSAGAPSYDFGSGSLTESFGIAVSPSSDRAYVGDVDTGTVKVFGPVVIVPTAFVAPATNVTGTKATLNGSVDPERVAVEECFFEWGETTGYGNVAPCEGAIPPDGESHAVHADVSGLTSDGATYHFRLVAKNENGTERSLDETLVTAPTVVTEGATALGNGRATLNGTLRPEGRKYTDCNFEYGLTSAVGFEDEAACEPDASNLPEDFSPHAVSLPLAGLLPNTEYQFRLTAATASGGAVQGKTLRFRTAGRPLITELIARDADRNAATLEATIDPRSFGTSYRIEWGPTASYGNVAATGAIAAGEGPTRVSARIADLSPATTYHYRVVADSTEGGETATPDQLVETLNSCGFTDQRCIELVSPAEKGPLASPGKKVIVGAQIQFQAAAGGSAIAYTVESGYPDTTAAVVSALYMSSRGVSGWSSQQLQPPTLGPPVGSVFKALSPDLGCGVVSSGASRTPDAPAAIVEAGGENLYRRDDATGSYQLITYLPPVGPPTRQELEFNPTPYRVVGMSPDCRRVIFRTLFRYPGSPTVGSARYQLYEWDGTILRNVAVIPGPGGLAEPVPAESLPGALEISPESSSPGQSQPTDYWRATSVDGTRSFFTSVSRFGGDSGQRAIFLRDVGNPAVAAGTAPATDVSQSETGTANDGNSRFWLASADGDRVFFTARYGLAGNGSSSGAASCSNTPFGGAHPGDGQGCDLYEYDAAAPAGTRLTDLSPDVEDPKGAGVIGVLDASEDGSYVYFAARGRLAGAGSRTEAENLEAGTYNIFLAHAGEVRFVGLLGESEALGGRALVDTSETNRWTSRSTRDGTEFAYESSLDVPGGGNPMVYLYSTGSDTKVCVSCRHDGQPPYSAAKLTPLIDAEETDSFNRNFEPTILTENGRLYFYSFDPLAPGAVEGDRNLYQWEHGQVSLIATEPPGVPRNQETPGESFFGGASADGGDVYFATPKGLVGTDRDERWDVYDARVDGVFPEPPPAPTPCDAGSEGACNGAGANPPAVTAPATPNFNGPGNPPATKHKKKRHHKKNHKRHQKKKHHKKAGNSRRDHDNRRAGK
jgi:hypothetical protein